MKRIYGYLKDREIWELVVLLAIILLPIQLRIILNPIDAYINSSFNYYLAFFIYASDIAIITALITYLMFSKLNNQIRLFILAILICSLLTFHMKREPFLWLYSYLKLLEFIGFGYLVSKLESKSIRLSLIIIPISAFLESLIGLYQYFSQKSAGLSWLGEYLPNALTPGSATVNSLSNKLVRAYGTFPHPNVLGAYLLIGLILAIYQYVSRGTEKRPNIIWLLIIGVLIAGVAVTFSRVIWLASFLFLIGTFIYWISKSRNKALNLAICGLVSYGTMAYLLRFSLVSRIINISSTSSYLERVDLNRVSLDLWKIHPILGTGWGNYIPLMIRLFHMEPWLYQPPHNIFLYLLASTGLIGLVVFISLLFYALRFIWNKNNTTYKLLLFSSIIAILFLGMFDHYFVTLQQGQLLFTLILGLSINPNLPHIHELSKKSS